MINGGIRMMHERDGWKSRCGVYKSIENSFITPKAKLQLKRTVNPSSDFTSTRSDFLYN